MDAETFLILPHPEVKEYMARKLDRDRWLRGMRRLRDKTGEGEEAGVVRVTPLQDRCYVRLHEATEDASTYRLIPRRPQDPRGSRRSFVLLLHKQSRHDLLHRLRCSPAPACGPRSASPWWPA